MVQTYIENSSVPLLLKNSLSMIKNKILAPFVLTCLLTLAPLCTSQAMENSEIGYIAGSGFSSLIYTPLKFASALALRIPGALSLLGTVPANAEEQSDQDRKVWIE